MGLLWALSSCGQSTEQAPLLVATAANMELAMEEIVEAFESQYTQKVELIVQSSGKLSSQILLGAPYDVFVAADTLYPHHLKQKGKVVGFPKAYARGRLSIWRKEHDMNWENAQKIAIPNPELAPYGMAAKSYLEQNGLLHKVKDKLVFGESVSQTNQYILTGNVDMGFTATSYQLPINRQKPSHWEVPSIDTYPELIQAAVIVNRGKKDLTATQTFFNFLFSDSVKSILRKYGYSIPS
ncbi:MAG: molybdate ABC transporter substrate-binding protein [Bacteroidota bacterium]